MGKVVSLLLGAGQVLTWTMHCGFTTLLRIQALLISWSCTMPCCWHGWWPSGLPGCLPMTPDWQVRTSACTALSLVGGYVLGLSALVGPAPWTMETAGFELPPSWEVEIQLQVWFQPCVVVLWLGGQVHQELPRLPLFGGTFGRWLSPTLHVSMYFQ